MGILERLMDLLRQLMQLLKSATGRESEDLSPHEVAVERRLYINSVVVDPHLCSREQATAFYATLDGFQQLSEELKKIVNMEDYESWFVSYNDWVETNWAQLIEDPSDGTAFLLSGLRALITHFALEALTGRTEHIPAYGALELAQSMANIDLPRMKNSRDPDIALGINRLVAGLPLCSQERTTQFHKTIDGFQAMTQALLETDWGPSLKEWLQSFHAWRNEAWGTFYEQPCGATLMRIHELESKIYLAAIMHVTGVEQADQASGLSKAIEEWWKAAIKDKTTIMNARKHS